MPDLSEGQGAVILNGELVFFDIRQTNIRDGETAVVVSAAGDVKVDACRKSNSQTMGPRSAMTSFQTEAIPGHRDGPVSWGCAILGKVTEVRSIRPRPVSISSNGALAH